MLSQSGETKDLHRCIPIARSLNVKILALVNVAGSLIARESDAHILLKAGREVAVASTKSFMNQTVMLMMLAKYLADKINSGKVGKLLLNDIGSVIYNVIHSTDSQTKELAKSIINTRLNSIFILGKGQLEWIAKEGALKLKEIAVVHTEGFSASSLKHGPFALLTDNVPVIILVNDDELVSKLAITCEEVSGRGARVILITNADINKFNPNSVSDIIKIDCPPSLFPFASVIPLQLLAYHMAILTDHNCDYPQGLAKCVTVS